MSAPLDAAMAHFNAYAKVTKAVTPKRQRECETCEGEGKVWTSRWGGNDPDVWAIPCPECGEPDPDDLRDQRADDRLTGGEA